MRTTKAKKKKEKKKEEEERGRHTIKTQNKKLTFTNPRETHTCRGPPNGAAEVLGRMTLVSSTMSSMEMLLMFLVFCDHN
jgi:hypothetical protein